METQFKVLGEAFPLPAPSEQTVSRDLLMRIGRRLAEQMSGLRYPGSSVDWRISANYALDQVRQARVGVVPMATHYAGELAPAHFTPSLHEALRLLLAINSLATRLRWAFEHGVSLTLLEKGFLRGSLHLLETQPDADRADDAAIAYAKEAA